MAVLVPVIAMLSFKINLQCIGFPAIWFLDQFCVLVDKGIVEGFICPWTDRWMFNYCQQITDGYNVCVLITIFFNKKAAAIKYVDKSPHASFPSKYP